MATRGTTGTSRRTRTGTGTTRTWHTTVQRRSGGRARKSRAALSGALLQTRRAIKSVGTWLSQTVTPGGWLLIPIALLGLPAGWIFGWIEMVGAGLLALVLILLALPFLLSTRTLDVRAILPKDRVVAGTPVTTQMMVANVGRGVSLPTQINLPIGPKIVDVAIPFLRAGHTFNQTLDLPAEKRGVITVGPPGATRSSPVGIFARETSWGEAADLYVYPQTVRLPSSEIGLLRDLEGEPSARLVNDDLSFHAIREYAPGDSQRHIHWKSTAKTGQLMVRQYEETVRSQMALVLDTNENSYPDERSFELAVAAAASFGLRGLQDGRELQFIAGAKGAAYRADGRIAVFQVSTASPRTLLDDMARVEESEQATNLAVLSAIASEGEGLVSLAIMVTGPEVTWNEIRKAALKFPGNVGVLVITCDPGAKPRLTAAGGVTSLTIGLLDDLPGLIARQVDQ